MSTPPDRQRIRQRTQDFLKTGSQFRLGELVTESANTTTYNLSELSQTDLPRALEVFKNVEFDALETLKEKEDVASELIESFEKCLNRGRRIFLCGCGATGRLALVLESVWRQAPREGFENSVIAFTAGGDYALVRSLGVFEDRPDLGAKHLLDLGFQNGDMLVAITEGGETPFVLGALDQATRTSDAMSWLLFCNPEGLLKKLVERSRLAIENPRVRSEGFEIEPMALTGSTRLQASSVLMAFVGICLRDLATRLKYQWLISELIDRVGQVVTPELQSLIEIESETHLRDEYTLHRSRSAAMAVLTDTTERAPTFCLVPFEAAQEGSAGDTPKAPSPVSRTYLEIPRTKTPKEAWRHLLRRDPRPFEKPPTIQAPEIGLNEIYQFDFSDGVASRRDLMGAKTTTEIDVEFLNETDATEKPTLLFRATSNFNGKALRHDVVSETSRDPLIRQCQMKFALNMQSTLAMGRIGRFHGNLMTFVRPTNGKLIDRALRTLRALAQEEARKNPDSKISKLVMTTDEEPFLDAIFEALDSVAPDEAVTLRALDLLRR